MRKVSSVGPDHAPDTVVASLIPAVLELELKVKECMAMLVNASRDRGRVKNGAQLVL